MIHTQTLPSPPSSSASAAPETSSVILPARLRHVVVPSAATGMEPRFECWQAGRWHPALLQACLDCSPWGWWLVWDTPAGRCWMWLARGRLDPPLAARVGRLIRRERLANGYTADKEPEDR